MVAVDAQILGGVAVTVLLALLFFGVVVLWDVALAIRGVADKIDKLEDTVDDDLTDVERAVSGAPGGGGPQVHLSGGGTITSGGSPRTQAGPHPSPRPDSPTGDPATDRRSPHAERTRRDSSDTTRTDSVSTARNQTEPNETTDPEEQAGSADPEPEAGPADPGPRRSRQSVGADPTPVRGATEAAEWSTSSGDGVTDTATDTDEEGPEPIAGDGSAEGDGTPNRGRFVTSPDRTPWYRTRLDWDAVVDGRSPIAGELEAGDVDATSTERANAEAASADEPIVVDPDGAATTEATNTSQQSSDVDDESTVTADQDTLDATDDANAGSQSRGTAEETITGDEPVDVPEDEPGHVPPDDGRSPSEDSAADGTNSSAADPPQSTPGTDPDDATDDADTPVSGPASERTSEDDVEEATDADSDAVTAETESLGEESSAVQPSDAAEPLADDGEGDPAPMEAGDADTVDVDHEQTRDVDEEGTQNEADEEGARDEVDKGGSRDEAEESEAKDQTADTEVRDEADDDDVEQDHVGETPDMEFTFEEFSPDDSSEPSLTVEDAVEAVNETDPSLSRSAHGVTSSAEKDDDGVVLVYDLETADAGQSTKRLLTYQLQSFANESDVDVDVSVAGNRIVVDIPEAEGTDVSQWEAAIVEVIDRTLYLSDSS